MKKGKKSMMILGSFLALSLMAACSSQSETDHRQHQGMDSNSTSTQKISAEDTYKQSCASCHGLNLEGAVGPNLQSIGNKMDEKQILEVITKGRGQMPGGLVGEEEAKSLAAWLVNKK